MSKWKDRGYVLDSDEEDVALDGPDEPTTSAAPSLSNTPAPALGHGSSKDGQHAPSGYSDKSDTLPRPASGQDKTIDTRHEEQDASEQVLSQELGDDSGVGQRQAVQFNKDAQTSPDQIVLQDASHNVSTTAPSQAKPSKGQPIVLITQPRRAYSPPGATSKNVKTYSRRGKPRQDAPAETTDQDDFVDIDMLVEDEAASHQPAVTQSSRRLSVSSSDLSDVDMQVLSSPQPFFTRPSGAATRNAPSTSPEGLTAASVVHTPAPSLSSKHLAAFAAPSRNFRARK